MTLSVNGMSELNLSSSLTTDLAGLKQVDRLTKDLAEVCPIDLIDHQEMRSFFRGAGSVEEPPSAHIESKRSFLGVRRQSHDEILIGDRRMKLDDCPAPGKVLPPHVFSQPRLARSGRPLKDDEATLTKERVDRIGSHCWKEIDA